MEAWCPASQPDASWGVGGGDGQGAQRAARTSMLNGVYGVAINAFIYVVFGKQICWWFTSDPAVHAVAVSILPVVAAYQAADGLRVVSAGCLRGVGRLNAALVSDVVGFWILGIPIGYYLALPMGMGAMGIWLGFAFGVIAVTTTYLPPGRSRSTRSTPAAVTLAFVGP